ncbi:MAG: EpsI family protein [bacterium]
MDRNVAARILATGVTLAAIGVASALRGAPVPAPSDVTLDALPRSLGGWTGQDLSVEPAVTEWLRSDAFTFREYRDAESVPVWVLVDYHRSQRLGATVHSPMHCYTGEGWSVESRARPAVGESARLGIAQWLRMRREGDRLVGAYWYETRSGATSDEVVLKLRVAGAALRRRPADAALVRLTTPVLDGDEEAACRRIERFAEAASGSLLRALPLGAAS